MIGRTFALLIFPLCALSIPVAFGVISRRDPLAEGAHRYPIEADVFLMLAPSICIYLLLSPLVWRLTRAVSDRKVAVFSLLAFVFTIAGLLLALGPVYRAIGRFDPTLADRLFFTVLPSVPVLVALALSLYIVRMAWPPRAAPLDS